MASAGSPPAAPDPNTLIQAQEQANRYNTSNPFGSTSWSDNGPGGHATMTQSMSPQMQAMMNQAFTAAGTPRQQMQTPEGLSQLTSAILGKVGARYGLGTGNANNATIPGMENFPHGGGGALNTNMSAKSNAPPQQPMGGMPGGAQMPQLGGGMQSPGMGGDPSTMPLQQPGGAQGLQGMSGLFNPQQMAGQSSSGGPPAMGGMGGMIQNPQQQLSAYSAMQGR